MRGQLEQMQAHLVEQQLENEAMGEKVRGEGTRVAVRLWGRMGEVRGCLRWGACKGARVVVKWLTGPLWWMLQVRVSEPSAHLACGKATLSIKTGTPHLAAAEVKVREATSTVDKLRKEVNERNAEAGRLTEELHEQTHRNTQYVAENGEGGDMMCGQVNATRIARGLVTISRRDCPCVTPLPPAKREVLIRQFEEEGARVREEIGKTQKIRETTLQMTARMQRRKVDLEKDKAQLQVRGVDEGCGDMGRGSHGDEGKGRNEAQLQEMELRDVGQAMQPLAHSHLSHTRCARVNHSTMRILCVVALCASVAFPTMQAEVAALERDNELVVKEVELLKKRQDGYVRERDVLNKLR